MTTITLRSPKDIRTDGGTQFRVTINPETVKEYAQLMKEGREFPAVIAFEDDQRVLWLADGFHRVAAAREAGLEGMPVEARSGSLRDAILFSLGANAHHGMRRTNDDIRKAVAFCLRDPELRLLSQRDIAEMCGCTQAGVSKIKNSLFPGTKQAKGKAAKADGAAQADNGYQPLDTSEQIVAAITDDERQQIFSALVRRSDHEYGEDKLVKRLERLGLLTIYGQDYQKKLEWTAIADAVQELLLGGDDWAQFEMTLYKSDRESGESSRYNRSFGQVKPLLDLLVTAACWVYSSDIPYAMHYWLDLLARDGYVQYHVVKVKDYDNRSFYHIDVKGCELLGLADWPEIGEPPTQEQLVVADKAREERARSEQRRVEAERKAKLDPAQEAQRERTNLLGWSTDSLRNQLKSAQWLDLTEAQELFVQFTKAVNEAKPRQQSEPKKKGKTA